MSAVLASWVHHQFDRLAETRPDLVEPVLGRAMREDEQFRWAMVVGAYLDEEINLGKAAELLGVHRLELQRQFVEKGIPLRLGPATAEEAQAEVGAWTAWMNTLREQRISC